MISNVAVAHIQNEVHNCLEIFRLYQYHAFIINAYHSLQIQVLFGSYYGEVITMRHPSADERREFFEDLILVQAAKVPIRKKRAGKCHVC